MKSNSELMATAVDRDPFNDTVRAAFTDALIEDGMWDKLAYDVALVRQTKAQAVWQLSKAAALIAEKGARLTALRTSICVECHIAPGSGWVLMLEEGCAAPCLYVKDITQEGAYWDGGTVIVGAVWVLKWNDRYQMARIEQRERAREVRKNRPRGPLRGR